MLNNSMQSRLCLGCKLHEFLKRSTRFPINPMFIKFNSEQTKKYIVTNVGMVKKLHDSDLSKQLQKIGINNINKCSNRKKNTELLHKTSRIDL